MRFDLYWLRFRLYRMEERLVELGARRVSGDQGRYLAWNWVILAEIITLCLYGCVLNAMGSQEETRPFVSELGL